MHIRLPGAEWQSSTKEISSPVKKNLATFIEESTEINPCVPRRLCLVVESSASKIMYTIILSAYRALLWRVL